MDRILSRLFPDQASFGASHGSAQAVHFVRDSTGGVLRPPQCITSGGTRYQNDIHFEYLVKVIFSRFVHYKVNIFPLWN